MSEKTGIPKRRLSDKLRQNSDHDLIIRHSVKIDNLCKIVREVGDKIDKNSEKMDHRCENRRVEFAELIENSSEDVMPKDTIKFVLGFVILGLISMVGVVGYNQTKIQKTETLQMQSLKHIKENQESIKKLQRIIDLKINQIPPVSWEDDGVRIPKQSGGKT